MTTPETYEEFMHPRGITMRVYGLTDQTPLMRVEIWCEHCGQKLSSTAMDVTAGSGGEQPAIIGELDAEAGVKHLETAHGL